MKRYIYEYDVPEFAFGGFPIVAHENAVNNPNAMFRRAIKPEIYQRAGLVSDPVNMFDVAPYADGAAAVVLMNSQQAKDSGYKTRAYFRAFVTEGVDPSIMGVGPCDCCLRTTTK